MVNINFLGDIALFREYQTRKTDPFRQVSLPDADYNIGNFEFIIPDNREKNFFDVSSKYAMEYDYFKTLDINLIQAYGMANNHCMDYGKDGIEDVIAVFKNKNVRYFGVGEEDFNVLKFELKGVSFAVIGFVKTGRWSRSTDNIFGPDPYDMTAIEEKITSLKKEVDHVILFPHFGTELVDIPDPTDVANSRYMIELGATAVIGHHPHIIQGIERYKDGIIAYSLGSFIYIPEYEDGYKSSQGENRNYSICLNLSFSKTDILKVTPVFYKYSKESNLPVLWEIQEPYFSQLDNDIDNPKAYYTKVRKQLLKREIISFYQRFRQKPIPTLKHYLSYLKLKHIKKIIS